MWPHLGTWVPWQGGHLMPRPWKSLCRTSVSMGAGMVLGGTACPHPTEAFRIGQPLHVPIPDAHLKTSGRLNPRTCLVITSLP